MSASTESGFWARSFNRSCQSNHVSPTSFRTGGSAGTSGTARNGDVARRPRFRRFNTARFPRRTSASTPRASNAGKMSSTVSQPAWHHRTTG
ncbi:hypothetical protein ACFFX0_23380 [Citricoccus parietis]|uniref:Uncharacterized protein n=1 Tax=Citricoccus parietis TaxID=592307 RepID=A0ABV5G4U7_9MICC